MTPVRGGGSLRERRSGVWEVRVSLGADPVSGRSRVRSLTVHGDWEVADAARDRWAADAAVVRFAGRARPGITVAHLLEVWLTADHGWRPSTLGGTGPRPVSWPGTGSGAGGQSMSAPYCARRSVRGLARCWMVGPDGLGPGAGAALATSSSTSTGTSHTTRFPGFPPKTPTPSSTGSSRPPSHAGHRTRAGSGSSAYQRARRPERRVTVIPAARRVSPRPAQRRAPAARRPARRPRPVHQRLKGRHRLPGPGRAGMTSGVGLPINGHRRSVGGRCRTRSMAICLISPVLLLRRW